MSNDTFAYLFMAGVGIFFIVALLGALKPLIHRLTGRKQQLEKADNQLEELKRQNELLSRMVEQQQQQQKGAEQ